MGPLSGNKCQYERFGLEAPRGILFHGAPGTGKTRLAQALSNEIGKIIGKQVHFIYRKGNDVASKYFGESSLNLREVFAEAIQNKPSVIFFDELDGLCPSRDKPHMTEAYVTIVTTMLGLMDELPRGQVFVIGATNRMSDIDPALRRPGRFDKYLEFQPPSEKGRHEILSIHSSRWKKKPTYEILQEFSQETNGFSGADLAKLCLDAFDQALTREIAAEKKRTHIFSYQDLKLTGLTVTRDDWTNALNKIKPSSTGVFGSSLFTPQSNAFCADYIRPLLEENLKRAAIMIRDKFLEVVGTTDVHSAAGTIHAAYIWCESESGLSSVHDYIMTPMFRLYGGELNDHPKYWLSTEMLYDTHVRDWPRQVNDAFSQAIAAHQPSILYIPNVNELCEAISDHQMTEAVNMKRQLERLRGTQVLLLTAGSTCPATFSSGGHSFKILSSGAATLEISISDTDRNKFFTKMSVPVEMGNWPQVDRACVKTIFEQVIQEHTKGQDVGSIVALYDDIRHTLNYFEHTQRGNPMAEDQRHEAMKSIANIVQIYKRTRSLVNREKISHNVDVEE